MISQTAKTARPTGGNCAPNGVKIRAQRGENARLTGGLSLWEIGSLQPLQSLHPLGGRDGGSAHARGLAFAAARCAERRDLTSPIGRPRVFPIGERLVIPAEISVETSVEAGRNTAKTPVKTAEKTANSCGISEMHVQVSLSLKIPFSRPVPGLCEAAGDGLPGGPVQVNRQSENQRRAYTEPPPLCGPRCGLLSGGTRATLTRLVSAICPESGQPLSPLPV